MGGAAPAAASDIRFEPFIEADAERVFAILSGLGWSSPATVAEAATSIRHFYNAAHVIGRKLLVDGILVGGGSLTRQKHRHVADLGFWIATEHQGRGWGTELARRLVEVGFAAGVHRISGWTASSNPRSMRVMEKAGLRREAVLRDALERDGSFLDQHLFAALAPDRREPHRGV
jgi:RimJ/RimL family protein N-acetyltransferase